MRKPILKVLILTGACAAAMGCTRTSSDTSRITFVVPALSNEAQKITTSSTYAREPETLDDINCFYVVMAGPEATLSDVSCGKNNPDNTLEEIFKGGLIVGGVRRSTLPGNDSFEAEVPHGVGRKFYLLGVKKNYDLDCFTVPAKGSLFNGLTAASIRSNVYILGQSEEVNLEQGKTVGITIPTSLDFENWIDACQSTAPVAVPVDANAPATHLFMSKATFPNGNRTVSDKCQPFEFELRNPVGALAELGSDLDVSLEFSPVTTSPLPTSGYVVETYGSYSDCNNDNSGNTSFEIGAGTKAMRRWAKTPAVPGGTPNNVGINFFARMTLGSINIIPAHFLEISQAMTPVRVNSPTAVGYQIRGPQLVQKDGCYKYNIQLRNFSGTSGSLGSTPYKFGIYPQSPTYRAFLSDDCTTSEITTTTSTTASTIYVRPLKGPGEGYMPLIIQPVANATTIHANTLHIKAAGDGVISGVDLIGPSVIQPNQCERYFLTFTNAHGAALPNSTGAAVTYSVSSASAILSLSSSCSSPGTSISQALPANSGGLEFFILKSTSGTPTLNLLAGVHTRAVGIDIVDYQQ